MTDNPQIMEALKLANESRLAAARVKVLVREGRLTVQNALQQQYIESCKVYSFLRAIPGFGPQRADRAMRYLGVASPSRKIGELTPRQRLLLYWIDKDVRS